MEEQSQRLEGGNHATGVTASRARPIRWRAPIRPLMLPHRRLPERDSHMGARLHLVGRNHLSTGEDNLTNQHPRTEARSEYTSRRHGLPLGDGERLGWPWGTTDAANALPRDCYISPQVR